MVKAYQKRICSDLNNIIKKIQKEEQRTEKIKYGKRARRITFVQASQILARTLK